jgi:hypothetical protein
MDTAFLDWDYADILVLSTNLECGPYFCLRQGFTPEWLNLHAGAKE